MKTTITVEENQLRELLDEMWKTQHEWQYKLLDLLNHQGVDSHVRAIRHSLNELESTLSARANSFRQELLERAE